jgi:hypothetical protein
MIKVFQNWTDKQKEYFYYGFLFFAVWLVFGNTLFHQYNLDDSYYIYLLPETGSNFAATLEVFTKWFGKSNYRPMPAFHMAIEQYLFGQRPRVFHFFNIFYYSLLGLLLYRVFVRFELFKAKWAIFLMVLFFLIHPSHSEVVASIKNRDVILSMLYGMLFSLTILKYRESRKIWLIPLALFFIIASVGSKMDGVLFVPFTGVILYFLKGVKLKRLLIPLFAIMGIAIGIYFMSAKVLLTEPEVKATTDFWENPMVQVNFFIGTILNTGLAVNYHKFMVIPKDYFFYFGFKQVHIPPLLSPQIIIPFLIHVAILIAALVHLIRGKRNKIMMGVIIYFLFLVPFILMMHVVAGIIAVRYSFNASLGFSIVVIGLYYWSSRKLKPPINFIPAVLLALVFIVFSYATFQRNKVWKNKETLFLNDLKGLNKSYQGNKMGGIYFYNISTKLDESNPKKREYLKHAERFLLTAKNIYNLDPMLHQKLGELYVQNQDYKKAFFSFKEAIALDSNNADSWQAYGNFCILANDYVRTEEAFRVVLNLDNDNVQAYKKFILALNMQSKFDEAIAMGEGMIKYPTIAKDGYENLGSTYWQMGDTLKALENYEMSIKLGNEAKEIKAFIQYFKR